MKTNTSNSQTLLLAERLVGTYLQCKLLITQARAQGRAVVWKSARPTVPGLPVTLPKKRPEDPENINPLIPVTPEEILAELTPESRRLAIVGDLFPRLALAYDIAGAAPIERRREVFLGCFADFSIVPADKAVVFKDAEGNPVDVSAELAAFAAKVASVETVEIVTHP